jgi:hypothetical protein
MLIPMARHLETDIALVLAKELVRIAQRMVSNDIGAGAALAPFMIIAARRFADTAASSPELMQLMSDAIADDDEGEPRTLN